MESVLQVLSVIVLAIFSCFASYFDLRFRRVPNSLFLISCGLFVILQLAQICLQFFAAVNVFKITAILSKCYFSAAISEFSTCLTQHSEPLKRALRLETVAHTINIAHFTVALVSGVLALAVALLLAVLGRGKIGGADIKIFAFLVFALIQLREIAVLEVFLLALSVTSLITLIAAQLYGLRQDAMRLIWWIAKRTKTKPGKTLKRLKSHRFLLPFAPALFAAFWVSWWGSAADITFRF